uniref:Uncharacterized protein n=1 Tax=Burkholderia orbicola (strain AU 1054) TaxID=331271 RepID=A0A0H2XKN0_BURO1
MSCQRSDDHDANDAQRACRSVAHSAIAGRAGALRRRLRDRRRRGGGAGLAGAARARVVRRWIRDARLASRERMSRDAACGLLDAFSPVQHFE